MKYKVLGGEWGEGYVKGDIIERRPEEMEMRLQKGEVEPVAEVEKPKRTRKNEGASST